MPIRIRAIIDSQPDSFFLLIDSYIYELCSTLDAVNHTTFQILYDFQDDGVRYLEL